jgi:hypothetical protein
MKNIISFLLIALLFIACKEKQVELPDTSNHSESIVNYESSESPFGQFLPLICEKTGNFSVVCLSTGTTGKIKNIADSLLKFKLPGDIYILKTADGKYFDASMRELFPENAATITTVIDFKVEPLPLWWNYQEMLKLNKYYPLNLRGYYNDDFQIPVGTYENLVVAFNPYNEKGKLVDNVAFLIDTNYLPKPVFLLTILNKDINGQQYFLYQENNDAYPAR